MFRHFQGQRRLALVAAVMLVAVGCTPPGQYIRNGLKVGPNYERPPAPLEQHWIDAADKRVREDSPIPCRWWQVFKDQTLNDLVASAYCQNLSLREAGFRILEARAQLGIVRGEIFPQLQNATGSYRRIGSGGQFFDQWNLAFNMAWELDFWGRFRRAVQAAEDTLEASVADYDDVLVTLVGDVANNYIVVRTDQERIRLLQENIEIQKAVLAVAEERLRASTITSVDVEQVRSNLLQNEAQIEQLEIDLRQAENRLCILLGTPPQAIEEELGKGPIPSVPTEVAVGMPADLLCRRPDVRRAERQAAAQAEQIGIAMADLYPAIAINGTLGWQARSLSDLFTSQSFNGSVGPSFQWDLLNYGRIANNVRLQTARLDELIAFYQNTVLTASAEVENGIVAFLRAQRRAELLNQSAQADSKAVLAIREQVRVGRIDFNQYAVIQQSLITQQDLWAQARGQIDVGLIQIYRALGGGWELRLNCNPDSQGEPAPPDLKLPEAKPSEAAPEEIPLPTNSSDEPAKPIPAWRPKSDKDSGTP